LNLKNRIIQNNVEYELIQVIGKGAFADVHLAIRRGFGLDRYVAIKIIDMSMMGEKHRTVIMDEAKLVGKLSHPNILHIYDCGMLGDQYFFIVLELVNGFSLKDLIQEHTNKVMTILKDHNPIPLSLMKNAAASILINTTLGLNYIHKAEDLLTGKKMQVIHNDLKPGNILIGFDGSLKVSDFGISYSPLRSVKLKGGSPAYMAPEWIQSLLKKKKDRPKVTVDIFGLGVTLYETLTDHRLFKAPRPGMERNEMLTAIYEQIKEVRPGQTLKKNPAADKNLCAIADRCLEFNPANRYQNCVEIIEEFDKAVENGLYQPGCLDRRFLSEYMASLYSEDQIHRYSAKRKNRK
jgi:eukaryotic-like serine/threonine-protein kinase